MIRSDSIGRVCVRSLERALTLLVAVVLACASPASDIVDDQCPDSPLLDELRERGSLRVIVRLDVEVQPEAELTDQQAAEQRQRIAALQEQVITDLAGTESEVVRRYERFPLLALHVEEPALCRLLASPLVRSVEVDTEASPTDSG